MLVAAVVLLGMLWFMGSLIGLVFKLVFGLIGGVFSLVGGVIGVVFGALALLVIGPLVMLAMLPALLPVLMIAGLVWLVVRATRRPMVVQPAPRSGF